MRVQVGVRISSKITVALGGLPDEIPVHEQPTPDVPA